MVQNGATILWIIEDELHRHIRHAFAAPGVRFWVGLSPFWSRWSSALWIVKPDTVIDWHRRGFRWYWTWFAMDSLVGHVSGKKRAT